MATIRLAAILTLSLTACYSWHAEPVRPLEAVAEAQPAQIRVTTADGMVVAIDSPAVHNDSIVGTTGEGTLRLAIDDISGLEVRRESAGKSLLLFLGIISGAAALGAATIYLTANWTAGN